MKTSILPVGPLLVVGALGILVSGPLALAQVPPPGCEHGVTILKSCDTPVRSCASDEDCSASACTAGVCDESISVQTNCVISVRNADECLDDIQVNAAFDTLLFPSGNQRVPAAGNLPILEVGGNAMCAAGPALPCIIGTPGSVANGLPGVGTSGRVSFVAQYTLTEANQADLAGQAQLPDQATVTVQDLCNGPNGLPGCNTTPNDVQFTAASPVVDGCEFQNQPVSTLCDTDDDLCTPEHCDGDGSCVPNGPTVTCPGATGVCDGGQECNPATGLCEESPDQPVSTFCETDDDLCTPEHCDGQGACVPNGPPVTCPGGDPPCGGGEQCNPATGQCEGMPIAPVSTLCDTDGDLCTPEHCDGDGSCVPNGPPVTCPGAEPPCEGGQECNPSSGQCENLPDAPVSTPCEGDDDACTTHHCDGNGACVFQSLVTCDDGDLCTHEVCDPEQGCITTGTVECDSGDLCAPELCNPATGQCELDPDHVPFLAKVRGQLGNGSFIGGGFGVNDLGGNVRFGRSVFVIDGAGTVGDLVRIGNGSNVYTVLANRLIVGRDVIIRGTTGGPTLPLTAPFCPVSSFTCGTERVTVATGTVTAPLAPGVYGAVQIFNGGTLRLAPGDFTFCDLRTGRNATILTSGNTTINVTGKVRLANGSILGPTADSPTPILNVLGPQVRVGAGSVMRAILSAPNALLTMGRNARFVGVFCVLRTRSDKGITLECPPDGGPSSPSGAFVE
jgi:hypothetical protein